MMQLLLFWKISYIKGIKGLFNCYKTAINRTLSKQQPSIIE